MRVTTSQALGHSPVHDFKDFIWPRDWIGHLIHCIGFDRDGLVQHCQCHSRWRSDLGNGGKAGKQLVWMSVCLVMFLGLLLVEGEFSSGLQSFIISLSWDC